MAAKRSAPALFYAGTFNGHRCSHFTVDDRLRVVRASVDVALMREALADRTLQVTVRKAIERRLRQLGTVDAS